VALYISPRSNSIISCSHTPPLPTTQLPLAQEEEYRAVRAIREDSRGVIYIHTKLDTTDSTHSSPPHPKSKMTTVRFELTSPKTRPNYVRNRVARPRNNHYPTLSRDGRAQNTRQTSYRARIEGVTPSGSFCHFHSSRLTGPP
jgi:hypothetical protein